MAASDELEYLKSLVAQLNDKIAALETKAKGAVTGHRTPAQQLRTILIGPPGAGKGTQAPRIRDEFCVCHLATGDMLREQVTKKTKLGVEAKKIMDAAGTQQGMQERFRAGRLPRTVPQAEKLDAMLIARKEKLDSVVQLVIEDQLLISRITGRLIHAASGRTYHKEFNPPKKPMVDDETGEPLIQRSDDNVEALRKRLTVFHTQTGPVVDYYKAKGLWHPIDAAQSPSVVWDNLRKVFTSKP
ncbi:Adenylate kinase [Grifola frondosa]|uniref:Adenylate kinase n=1 Tax=Grifola frondosa TaxID=5627 RepID=A0A1C7MG85_GRIFR|nr:Adenylate kinase [Grifola frondosa]